MSEIAFPRQKAFDWAVGKIRRQGQASLSKSLGCDYFGQGGRRCAIGWLLPEDSDFRGTSQYVDEILAGSHLVAEQFCQEVGRVLGCTPESVLADRDFLRDLQDLHDRAAIVVRRCFGDIAQFRTASPETCPVIKAKKLARALPAVFMATFLELAGIFAKAYDLDPAVITKPLEELPT